MASKKLVGVYRNSYGKRDTIMENVTDKIAVINITVLATVTMVDDVETFSPMI
jgi:hypothetical protein